MVLAEETGFIFLITGITIILLIIIVEVVQKTIEMRKKRILPKEQPPIKDQISYIKRSTAPLEKKLDMLDLLARNYFYIILKIDRRFHYDEILSYKNIDKFRPFLENMVEIYYAGKPLDSQLFQTVLNQFENAVEEIEKKERKKNSKHLFLLSSIKNKIEYFKNKNITPRQNSKNHKQNIPKTKIQHPKPIIRNKKIVHPKRIVYKKEPMHHRNIYSIDNFDHIKHRLKSMNKNR